MACSVRDRSARLQTCRWIWPTAWTALHQRATKSSTGTTTKEMTTCQVRAARGLQVQAACLSQGVPPPPPPPPPHLPAQLPSRLPACLQLMSRQVLAPGLLQIRQRRGCFQGVMLPGIALHPTAPAGSTHFLFSVPRVATHLPPTLPARPAVVADGRQPDGAGAARPPGAGHLAGRVPQRTQAGCGPPWQHALLPHGSMLLQAVWLCPGPILVGLPTSV